MGCPNRISAEVHPTLDLIDFFHDGNMPVAGGVLDQSAWFLDAARFLKAEENRIDMELFSRG